MSPETRHTGLLLSNRYSLDEPVGRGALFTIYRGSDTVLRRSVAVKAVAPEFVERYREALAATAGLTHPAAIATYDALEHDGWLFLVQEYVTGRPLSTYLRDGLPSERAVDLMCQVARAIAYAHTHGIVHGDLTPASVLVDRQAVARVNNFASPPDADYFARCRSEIPPAECASLDEPVCGSECDVRAVGYLLWQLLSEPRSNGNGTSGNGTGSVQRAFRADVPETVRDCVRKCIGVSGPNSIGDAEALVSSLEALSDELARARTQAIEHTPPALRIAREMVAREAAWSAEETLGGVRYWPEAAASDLSTPSAPTDPISRDAGPWSGVTPEAELTPRLRLPSRPLDDALSSAMSDYAAMAAGSPAVGTGRVEAPGAPLAGRATAALAPAHQRRHRLEMSLALVVGLGIAFFVLCFILGYFTSHLFGIG